MICLVKHRILRVSEALILVLNVRAWLPASCYAVQYVESCPVETRTLVWLGVSRKSVIECATLLGMEWRRGGSIGRALGINDGFAATTSQHCHSHLN